MAPIGNPASGAPAPADNERNLSMIKWIFILLAIAAIAALLGFGTLSGVALTGAKVLIGIVLILFLLVLFGIIAVLD